MTEPSVRRHVNAAGKNPDGRTIAVRPSWLLRRCPGLLCCLLGALAGCQDRRAPVAAHATAPRAVQVAEYGCAECAGLQHFGAVEGFGVMPDGSIVLVSALEPVIRMFGPDSVLKGFGRHGEGPGEFNFPRWVYGEPDGKYLVHDFPSVKRFLGDEFVSAMIMPARLYTKADYDPVNGELYTASTLPTEGADGDRVDKWRVGHELIEHLETLIPSTGLPATQYAFAVAPGGGFAIGVEAEYRIRRFDADGGLLYEFGRDIPRRPRTASEMARDRGLHPGAWVVDELWPHFGHFSLEYDDDGTLWVLTTRGEAGASVMDLFASAGDYIGEVVLPGSIRTELQGFRVGNGFLVALVTEDNRIDRIVVWELRPDDEPSRNAHEADAQ